MKTDDVVRSFFSVIGGGWLMSIKTHGVKNSTVYIKVSGLFLWCPTYIYDQVKSSPVQINLNWNAKPCFLINKDWYCHQEYHCTTFIFDSDTVSFCLDSPGTWSSTSALLLSTTISITSGWVSTFCFFHLLTGPVLFLRLIPACFLKSVPHRTILEIYNSNK